MLYSVPMEDNISGIKILKLASVTNKLSTIVDVKLFTGRYKTLTIDNFYINIEQIYMKYGGGGTQTIKPTKSYNGETGILTITDIGRFYEKETVTYLTVDILLIF